MIHLLKLRLHKEKKEKNIFVKLHVASSDMGKVIGKKGRIAKAIRTVVKSAAQKSDKKIIVDIED